MCRHMHTTFAPDPHALDETITPLDMHGITATHHPRVSFSRRLHCRVCRFGQMAPLGRKLSHKTKTHTCMWCANARVAACMRKMQAYHASSALLGHPKQSCRLQDHTQSLNLSAFTPLTLTCSLRTRLRGIVWTGACVAICTQLLHLTHTL